jgi:hypothetical protein
MDTCDFNSEGFWQIVLFMLFLLQNERTIYIK